MVCPFALSSCCLAGTLSAAPGQLIAKSAKTPRSVTPKTAIWLFEDQLRPDSAALLAHPDAPILMIESRRAMSLVPSHRKRLVFLISAMRHFEQELRALGRKVHRYGLDRTPYFDSLSAIRDFSKSTGITHFIVTEPSEHHTLVWLQSLPTLLGITIDIQPSDQFITDRAEFAAWTKAGKAPIMESFYRKARVQHKILIDSDRDGKPQPIGGEWNLDKENRKVPKGGLLIPPLPRFAPDEITRQVMLDVDRVFPSNPGLTAGFDLAVTRSDAQTLFDDFLKKRLIHFGDFEDAMLTNEPYLYHSFISPQLNAGLLEPMALIRAVEKRFRAGHVPLNSAEGFIRQILGWREYVRGIYWAFMPEYRTRNSREETRPLPEFFWTGDTKLNCLRVALTSVIERAYTHHIQRLMVICNFATLAGLSPQEVNDWFLAMYADSHDWVVTPNVVGMGLNADHGIMATKPYVSSAVYIDRMSDHCDSCSYSPKERTGPRACPFNYLFWTFLDRHKTRYAKNVRMSMMLKNLARLDTALLAQLRSQSQTFLTQLNVRGGKPSRGTSP